MQTTGIALSEHLVSLRAAYEQVASNAASFAAFDSAVKAIDWNAAPPSAFEEAINMALQLDGIIIARELANRGHEKYPGNARLASAAHVLAPPRVIERNKPPKKGLSASMAWLGKHANEYRRCWVAVQNGDLLGTAATRSGLVEKLGELASESNVLIVRIP